MKQKYLEKIYAILNKNFSKKISKYEIEEFFKLSKFKNYYKSNKDPLALEKINIQDDYFHMDL